MHSIGGIVRETDPARLRISEFRRLRRSLSRRWVRVIVTPRAHRRIRAEVGWSETSRRFPGSFAAGAPLARPVFQDASFEHGCITSKWSRRADDAAAARGSFGTLGAS